jgi:hypothetical protein
MYEQYTYEVHPHSVEEHSDNGHRWPEHVSKSKAIPVTGLGGLQGWDVKDPTLLDNRLTDGGKAVSPTHLPQFIPQKYYYFYVSGTHFC